ncbi:MAG: response regulator receiver protein [Verrucomicrobiales bacterium]|nr:response regulator receiver protein [Verrucomicrobiales bacterium]
MPIKSGLDILEWLRDHPNCKVIPITILSSSKQASDVKRAYELGVNAYCVKPALFADFEKLLKNFFGFWEMCEIPDIPQRCT